MVVATLVVYVDVRPLLIMYWFPAEGTPAGVQFAAVKKSSLLLALN